mgnify:FL=1
MFSSAARREIRERSAGLCERKLPDGKRCLAPAVEEHHIVAKGMGGRHGIMKRLINDPRNGIDVCRQCHEGASTWNDDADDLVPGKEFRERLRRGNIR